MFNLQTKILVVDDMMTMRKIVIKNLKELGFTNFIEAADGNLAWTAFTESAEPVGLIVSDWNMPNCSGVELLRRVKADPRFKKTGFILVTAEAESHQVAEAVKAGVDQYVVKPFTKESLQAKLTLAHKKLAA